MSEKVIRPGLLVSLSARVQGGVAYSRVDLDANNATDGVKVERWETTKVVDDPAEFERATKIRGKCRSLISSVCTHTEFGLLCPASKEKALDEAIQESRALADAFNKDAKTAIISVFVLKGRIAESDGEAARAISSELRGLLDTMKAGIEEADVAKIREAANRAKKMGAMLDDSVAGKVSAAVEEARSAARAIVKRVQDGGEPTALVVQELNRKALEEARFAFLDLEGPAKVEGEALPVVESRGLDLESEAEAAPVKHEPKQLDLIDEGEKKAATANTSTPELEV